jgi:hypothetical protein
MVVLWFQACAVWRLTSVVAKLSQASQAIDYSLNEWRNANALQVGSRLWTGLSMRSVPRP